MTIVNCIADKPLSAADQFVILGFSITHKEDGNIKGTKVQPSYVEAYVVQANLNMNEVIRFLLKSRKNDYPMEKNEWEKAQFFCMKEDGIFAYCSDKEGKFNVTEYVSEPRDPANDKAFAEWNKGDGFLFEAEGLTKFLKEGVEQKEKIITNYQRSKHCAALDLVYNKQDKAVVCKKDESSTRNDDEKLVLKGLTEIDVTIPTSTPPPITTTPPIYQVPPKPLDQGEQLPLTPINANPAPPDTKLYTFIGFIVGGIIGYMIHVLKLYNKTMHKKSSSQKKVVEIVSKRPIITSGDEEMVS